MGVRGKFDWNDWLQIVEIVDYKNSNYKIIVVMFIDSSDKYDIHIKYNNTI